jgi:hypothetical protein
MIALFSSKVLSLFIHEVEKEFKISNYRIGNDIFIFILTFFSIKLLRMEPP